MKLGFETGEKTSLSAESVSLLRRISASFNLNESISFEGSICERKTIDGDTIDVNWKTAKSTYSSQDELVNLASLTWNPSTEELKSIAEEITKGKTQAVEIILSSFIKISKAATQAILSQKEELEPED